ncbi:hypothetical protein YC2023_119702 [Brassica napus]
MQNGEAAFEETEVHVAVYFPYVMLGLGTIQILADALPNIVPYVLINHREACFSLSRNVGEMRTETELLPQCWEQINHTYQERRLLVAQSCGELAEYVRPEICDSLILSIIQQLIEDSATVVREAAAHNLALLLPLFPNTDKYFKVEEMMFQFICDPSGLVAETTLKELLPAVMKCSPLSRIELRTGITSHCPPLSGVEGSLESHLRVLAVYQKAVETCSFPSTAKSEQCVVSVSLLGTYAEERSEWPMFEWMHVDKRPETKNCSINGRAAHQSDLTGATLRGRSRFHGETTQNEARSDLSERPTEVDPEVRSDLLERHTKVARVLSSGDTKVKHPGTTPQSDQPDRPAKVARVLTGRDTKKASGATSWERLC